MEHRNLGDSDLKVSAIAFGAWAVGGWQWGGNDDRDAIEAMRVGFDHGVTSIDTAPIYGQGKSEELVGQLLKDLPRDQVQVLTKGGMRWDLTKGDFFFKSQDNHGNNIDVYKYNGYDSIIWECEQSLRRLGTDYIDLYQIHWPDSTTPISETMEALLRLQEQGKILQAGVSNYTVAMMEEAERTLNIVSNQIHFSMVKNEADQDVVPHCIANNKSILAYSPQERGLLTGKMKPGQQFGEGDSRAGGRFFKDENINRTNEFLSKIKHIADDKGATLGQLVLRWTIDHPGITVALAGARNADQSIQNAKAVDIKLSAEEIEFIDTQLSELQLVD